MQGLKDTCDRLVSLFRSAPIRNAFGMDIGYDDESRAIFDLPYNPNFDHAMNGIHGGVIATLLDNAGWFTAAAHYGVLVVTVEFHTRLLEPVSQEYLVSIGRIIRAGKRLAVCEMEVKTKSGRVIAIGSGTFAVTPHSLERT